MENWISLGSSMRIMKARGERRKAKERLKTRYLRSYLLIFLLLHLSFASRLSPFASLSAQNLKDSIYTSYITGDMSSWERALINVKSPEKLGTPALYEVAMAHYGFIGYCLGRDEKSRARPYLDKAEELTTVLLAREPDDPRFLALRGALYGLRLGYQPQKVMTLGPKAQKIIGRAVELGPESPQVWIESGNKDWHMPAAFGGSREKAIQEYKMAIQLMEKDPDFIKQNWYYLNVHMILASWYESRNMSYFAHETYRKILQVEPRFNWAREKLGNRL
jgi:tetratricopeptide (TPR) repeat protein